MKAVWGLTNPTINNKPGGDFKLFQEQTCRLSPRQNIKRGSIATIFEEYSCTLPTRSSTADSCLGFSLVDLRDNVENQDRNKQVTDIKNIDSNKTNAFQREKIVINIRGRIYETFADTLGRFPNTLLGCSEKREAFYEAHKRQYNFGLRDISAFDAILFYYQSNGILARPADVDSQTFYNEICYFQLDDSVIQLFLQNEGLQVQRNEEPKPVPGGTVWKVLEYPSHSTFAQMFAIFSLLVICFSIVIYCGETLPSVRKNPAKESIFNSLEIFCISWFTFEYLLRVFFSPHRKKFCFSAIGCIDALAIVPFYVTTIMDASDIDTNDESRLCCVVRVLKLLRVLRVLKFSRYVQGMNVLGLTLIHSAKELFLLILCMLMCSVLFASFAYFADASRPDTKVGSIPDGIWFAIITFTYVGYGDIVPLSDLGKLNATVCIVVSVVVLSLPMPVIVSNFTKLYYRSKQK